MGRPSAGLAGPHLSAACDLGADAAVLCPIVVDDAYLGYLLLLRVTPTTADLLVADDLPAADLPAAGYGDEEVDLARSIAGEVGLALSAARWSERLKQLPGWTPPYELLPGERVAPRW